jgi:hypothetical protein
MQTPQIKYRDADKGKQEWGPSPKCMPFFVYVQRGDNAITLERVPVSVGSETSMFCLQQYHLEDSGVKPIVVTTPLSTQNLH